MAHEDVNWYGRFAEVYWQLNRPEAYGALENRERFFADLGHQLYDQVNVIAAATIVQRKAELSLLSQSARLAEFESIRDRALQHLCADMLASPPPPESAEVRRHGTATIATGFADWLIANYRSPTAEAGD